MLVLDDLGAEKTSEWVEETLNLIVNTRYNERRATIFTSNYPDLPPDSNPAVITLHDRIGFRMRSRCTRCAISSISRAPTIACCCPTRVCPALKRNWEERRMRGKLDQAGACQPPGEGAAPRRRQSRPKMVGWPRWIQMNAPGSLRPRSVLQLDLQLLQLQSRPVRRCAEDALCGGAAAERLRRR